MYCSFFEGSCYGSSPIQVEYIAYNDRQACQPDLTCSSDGYQRYGMNAPVNLTIACVTGAANYGVVTPKFLSQQYGIPLKGGTYIQQKVHGLY